MSFSVQVMIVRLPWQRLSPFCVLASFSSSHFTSLCHIPILLLSLSRVHLLLGLSFSVSKSCVAQWCCWGNNSKRRSSSSFWRNCSARNSFQHYDNHHVTMLLSITITSQLHTWLPLRRKITLKYLQVTSLLSYLLRLHSYAPSLRLRFLHTNAFLPLCCLLERQGSSWLILFLFWLLLLKSWWAVLPSSTASTAPIASSSFFESFTAPFTIKQLWTPY